MRRIPWLLTGALCAVAPASTPAQTQQQEDNFIRSFFSALFGPDWNIHTSVGSVAQGRFLLQNTPGGERELRGERTVSIGGGGGVDLLPRVGFRIGYTYSNTDLRFEDDNGFGAKTLDVGNVGGLASHVASLEVVRYMLPSRVVVTPYASAGVSAAWWLLDEKSPLVREGGGGTQFRMGALATFGLQVRLSGQFFGRLEAATGSVRNPFAGNESYVATGGATVDEPTRVSATDYRFAVVYRFGKAKAATDPIRAASKN